MLQSLNGLPQDTVRQLTQVFANCNQALGHRAGVSLSRGANPNQGGLINMPAWATGNLGENGVPFGSGSWQSGNYYGGDYYGTDGPRNSQEFIYNAGNQLAANYAIYNENSYVGGSPFEMTFNNSPYRGGDTYVQHGDSPYYDLKTDVTNQTTFEYGGPIFQVAGDTYTDNSITNNNTTNNQYVTNQTVENHKVYNLTVGDSGAPGTAGPAGPPGAAGNPGAAGPGGADGATIFLPPTDQAALGIEQRKKNVEVQGFVNFTKQITIRIPYYEWDEEACELVETINFLKLDLNQAFPEFNGITTEPVLVNAALRPRF